MDINKKREVMNELYRIKGALEHARLLLVRDVSRQSEFLEELKSAHFKLGNIISDCEKPIPKDKPRSSEERQEQS